MLERLLVTARSSIGTLPATRTATRWVILAAVVAGLGNAAGCSTAPVVACVIRGASPDASAKPLSGATGSVLAANDWTMPKEPERPVQWAEARTPATTQPTVTSTVPVLWRAQANQQTDGPALVQQAPMLAVPQPPAAGPPVQQAEPIAQPRVLHADPAAMSPPAVVLSAPVPGAPNELRKVSLPPYRVAPPDILLIESTRGLPTQPVKGQHLVRPDGTINLGLYGSVYVAGLTLDQVKAAVVPAIASRLDPDALKNNPVKVEDVSVDVLAYNSKVYYVITDGGGYGEQVYRIPATGNETVLDALAQIYGLPAVASKKHIWVARRTLGPGTNNVLPVDWCGITQRGEVETNYQLFPGDRVYVQADKLITADSWLAKLLAPVERVLGVTLLGSSTVNSIRNRTGTTSP
jgi:polysaccharide export outer membrane protein